MAGEKERVEGYLETVARLEPDIHHIDASAFYASAAISLKRIADGMELRALGDDPTATRAFAMLTKLRANDGECIGDHPDWMREIDDILAKV